MRQHPTTGRARGAVGTSSNIFSGGLDFHSDGKVEIVEEEAMSASVEGIRQQLHKCSPFTN